MSAILQPPFNPAAPGAIGGTTPAAGTFTTLFASGISTFGNGSITVQTNGSINAGGGDVYISNSNLKPLTNNGFDVGGSGIVWRDGYFGRSVIIGTPAAKAGGKIFQDFVDGASTSTDGTEDTLATHTLVASTFGTNGDVVSGFFQIAIVGHAVSTDRNRLYAAGTAIFDTAALNFPISAQLTVAFEIVRVSATVLRAAVFATTTSATLIPYSQYTEITGLTLSNTQIIALKSISTGTNSAAGDVTMKLGRIEWQPAA